MSDAWLPDYCLYMAIKEENKMCDWQTWPAPLRLRDPKALEEFRTGHADELGFWAFVQYEFAKQWQALKAYANSKGIKIMGDIPIYVAADSADAWAGRELFEMDSEGHPRRVAGCPPDYLPRMASCGATRCMTGPTTSVPTMPGGCAACAMR